MAAAMMKVDDMKFEAHVHNQIEAELGDGEVEYTGAAFAERARQGQPLLDLELFLPKSRAESGLELDGNEVLAVEDGGQGQAAGLEVGDLRTRKVVYLNESNE